MTKAQVKHALQRGLGRGILAVRANPDRYKEIVLWACGRNLSFDTQCEGTRAWYVYQLILTYSDSSEFLHLIEQTLRGKKPGSSWEYLHLAQLLMYFAMDGNEKAEIALWEKFEELLARLKSLKRSSWLQRRVIDCFETICIALSWNKENYFKVAETIGGLFLESPQYNAWDFSWLNHSRPSGFNTALRRKAKKSQEISAYLSAFDEQERKWEQEQSKRMSANRQGDQIPEGGRRLSIYLKRKAPDLAMSYAEIYLSQKNPEERAKALAAFSVCPYPLDPTPILKDAESDCPELRSAAMDALGEIKNPKLREYALKNLEENMEEMFPLFIKNYLPEDEAFLHKLISDLPVDYACECDWHTVHLDIYELFEANAGITKPPKSLLPLLYESTLCSI